MAGGWAERTLDRRASKDAIGLLLKVHLQRLPSGERLKIGKRNVDGRNRDRRSDRR